MAYTPFTIDPDITRARTLPARAYSDPETYTRIRERVLARSWQIVADVDQVKIPGAAQPTVFLEGSIDEPLLVTRDYDDKIHCLSNVCTHRGTILAEHATCSRTLTCRYHGRRFALDGTCKHMPEFEGVEGFPSPSDHLPKVQWGRWGKLIFAALDPVVELEELLEPIRRRLAWFDADALVLEPARSRDYLVKANWALYCDNFLEGFHIPFVHAGLNEALDFKGYTVETLDHAVLQLGITRDRSEAFDLPASSPDHGRLVAAYYYFLFPNTMLNIYPWGVSVNIVKPLAVDRTRITYLTYVSDASRLGQAASADLDRVEREDEAIVESVQRGTRARLYEHGRYSPTQERGVHHFHRLLGDLLG